jgi:branched-chain amino acid transport system permease protein
MWRPCGVFDDSYAADLAIVRTWPQRIGTVAGLALLFALPALVPGHILNTVNYIAITVIAVQGVNILTGLTGQITLGQAGFMAVGAYVTTLLVKYAAWSFWFAMPVGVLAAGLAGIVVGLPSLRIKGFYLALATVAAQFIIPWLIVNVRPDLTGGTDPLTVPAVRAFGVTLNTQSEIFYVCMGAAVLVTVGTRNLMRARIGRAFVMVRDNDRAAEILGVSVYKHKLLAFFLCSLYAGLAGALFGAWARGITVENFGLHESIWYLGMLIVGGAGSVPGAVFGAILVRALSLLVTYVGPIAGRVLPETRATAVEIGLGPLVFGAVVLGFLMFEPRGLARIWERFKSYYRLWPYPY